MDKKVLSSTSKLTNVALHCVGINDKSIMLHKLPAAKFPSGLSKFDSWIRETWYKFYAISPHVYRKF